ncbi:sulfate ABC transporter permease subunit CysT [Acetivibrio mesophilus]|uniref:Sulfate transport system permease protein CysT n=1 Tax=Acetivibrio mesophilus TaxID=2487273 RepID=A0A4Q0I1M4_9FIRM|nr:sulfate ABC transporter permease subunit CysT [Acetivibrio mesophilus]ODM27266.1 sulfate ABC transporter permease subunit CysT [Clostridium sp. Bc-iso-3]RXE58036.1 sulfate ABC transporter permease subunit CysT [Acetivibrio mesophilus]HHV29803.1 sulfate ABC transporter permease subunit CysT [Clostridium sp.]
MNLLIKPFKIKQKSVIPGFGITMGFSLTYLTLLVLIPVSMVFLNSAKIGPAEFWEIASSERVLASLKISFSTSFLAAVINVIFGLLLAWVLERYTFWGKKLIDGLIDLPFALPTAVAGISLTTLYSQNGWIGKLLAPLGIKVSYTPIGIVVALVFIGFPFVVRTVQPVLESIDLEVEEAAACLGATRFQTFYRVILPELLPALITGFALAFSRALGEYGSVVFISGNMPMKTEITPLLIRTKLEQYDYAGGTAVAAVMLIISFILLLLINIFQWWASNRHKVS